MELFKWTSKSHLLISRAFCQKVAKCKVLVPWRSEGILSPGPKPWHRVTSWEIVSTDVAPWIPTDNYFTRKLGNMAMYFEYDVTHCSTHEITSRCAKLSSKEKKLNTLRKTDEGILEILKYIQLYQKSWV